MKAAMKQVGIVLLAVGILDLLYGIYSLLQAENHSFKGILIALAGIYIIRGSLRAARIVRWVAAFGISSIIATLFIAHPLLNPAELRAIEFNLYPNRLISWYVTQIAHVSLCYWIYRQLRVIDRRGNSFASTPKSGFILGLGLIVLLTAIAHFTVNGAAGTKAVELAQQQYGENYKYHVVGLERRNGTVSAHLNAYNEKEIKTVKLNWKN